MTSRTCGNSALQFVLHLMRQTMPLLHGNIGIDLDMQIDDQPHAELAHPDLVDALDTGTIGGSSSEM